MSQVHHTQNEVSETVPYPLRDLPIQYIEPTEPVALEDWDVLSQTLHPKNHEPHHA
ncbi:MAG: hypothetical protein AAGD25_23480 [Cyanobacteria bacterium P01_F01_bin.150]